MSFTGCIDGFKNRVIITDEETGEKLEMVRYNERLCDTFPDPESEEYKQKEEEYGVAAEKYLDELPKISIEDAVGQGIYEKIKEEAKTRPEPMRIDVSPLQWVMGCVRMNSDEASDEPQARKNVEGMKRYITCLMPQWQFLSVSAKSEFQKSERVNPLIKGILDRSYGFCYMGPDDKDEEKGLIVIKNRKGLIEQWNFFLDKEEGASKKLFDVEVGKLPHCTDVTEETPD